jgi:hypothetical protein
MEEALEDLEYMMERFRNHHPAWLEEENKSVEAVEKQYGAEVAAIKEAQGEISVLALYQAASRIAAKMHDGHTYPYWSGEELRYIHDFTQVNTLGKPIAIDGIPTVEILDAYKASGKKDTFITLEPHLQTFAGLHALVGKNFENPYKYENQQVSFTDAVEKLKELL